MWMVGLISLIRKSTSGFFFIFLFFIFYFFLYLFFMYSGHLKAVFLHVFSSP